MAVPKVLRVSEEVYARVRQVSQAYGLSLTQAANLLILGRVRPGSNGHLEEAFSLTSELKGKEAGLKCPQCRRTLGLMMSAPGVYVLKCPVCYQKTQMQTEVERG